MLLPYVLISILASSGVSAATDAPLRFLVGPHLIEEVRSDDAQPRLLMDGKILFDGANRYDVKLRHSIGGVPVAIVYADTSGASCMAGATLFIAGDARSVADAGMVENNSCWTTPKYYVQSADAGPEALLVQQDPGLGYSGDLWNFTPRTGLHKVADLTYAPEPGTTYQNLRAHVGQGKPIELFRNEAFSNDFDRLTGSAKPEILPAVGDADPNALIEGRFLIAEGFQPHNAGHQALIVVDLSGRSVFVADYPGEGKIAVFPIVSLWPSPIRRKLAAWAKIAAPASVETAGRQ
ncbi:hypothetical protein [Beijerinckia sp. L45]|uniref:hypothetical protein n=1 Tax=Beijerinckia sp. L45 TaxID=1641855 RepID=UPI00131E1282|nr:hypothetical protein [Beijerinckia sp. L45]